MNEKSESDGRVHLGDFGPEHGQDSYATETHSCCVLLLAAIQTFSYNVRQVQCFLVRMSNWRKERKAIKTTYVLPNQNFGSNPCLPAMFPSHIHVVKVAFACFFYTVGIINDGMSLHSSSGIQVKTHRCFLCAMRTS